MGQIRRRQKMGGKRPRRRTLKRPLGGIALYSGHECQVCVTTEGRTLSCHADALLGPHFARVSLRLTADQHPGCAVY
jgi:hypothetical protein